MPFEPGRIVLVHYPFTDATAAKVRPALVVSRLEFNQGEDVVVLPISSRVIKEDPYGFPILETDDSFAATKLKVSSTVRWTKPMTISASVVFKKLGVIPRSALTQVIGKLYELF